MSTEDTPRKRRPHHLCPGPNCNVSDMSKWVNDGAYFRPEDEILLHKMAIAIQDARPATYKAMAAAALAAYRAEQANDGGSLRAQKIRYEPENTPWLRS